MTQAKEPVGRTIVDAGGREWAVWEVSRAFLDTAVSANTPLPEELRDGWLCFHHHDEMRRLAPIPCEWELMSEQQLLELLQQSRRIGRERNDDHRAESA